MDSSYADNAVNKKIKPVFQCFQQRSTTLMQDQSRYRLTPTWIENCGAPADRLA